MRHFTIPLICCTAICLASCGAAKPASSDGTYAAAGGRADVLPGSLTGEWRAEVPAGYIELYFWPDGRSLMIGRFKIEGDVAVLARATFDAATAALLLHDWKDSDADPTGTMRYDPATKQLLGIDGSGSGGVFTRSSTRIPRRIVEMSEAYMSRN